MLSLLALALASCGPREDFEYIDQSEIPPGPGLFTGDGKFEIIGVTTGGDVVVGDDASELSDEGMLDAPKTEAEREQVPEGLAPDKRYRSGSTK
ncbi:MAG: hypothetical protein QNJ94_13910 [Alphaproteobacteria bacterium]|nr:hypothetical protein [Alphaproteobacteria bacterium]